MESTISSVVQDTETEIFYPDSDGKPMANNTLHYEYIATTKHGLESVFADRDDVFVAADLFWYPVEGLPKIVLAPDVMVAIGRPKGQRKSYMQWLENNIAPQVVFEFLSSSNTTAEMTGKAIFFERYGVQEYYIYDIGRKKLSGFIRYLEYDDKLEEIADMKGWKSPRLGITFEIVKGKLLLRKPDGTPFLTYDEYSRLENILDKKIVELKATEVELGETKAELGETKAELGETKAELGETKAELGETKAELDSTKEYAAALAAKLRALGINPDEA